METEQYYTIYRYISGSSPFGGIPRNWKRRDSTALRFHRNMMAVPPSGGSLEIGNKVMAGVVVDCIVVPPSGGSLEIGNELNTTFQVVVTQVLFPLRGDP